MEEAIEGVVDAPSLPFGAFKAIQRESMVEADIDVVLVETRFPTSTAC
jgi:hypothetical protein